jgi:pSer/pThr/pTyr-binding forkhead associated (FHA) protein
MNSKNKKHQASLLIMGERAYFKFEQAIIRIGRSSDNDLIIENAFVSRHHAEIRYRKMCYEVIDLGSTSGTYVNGEKIERHFLSKGDVITLANMHLVFGQEEFSVKDAPSEYQQPNITRRSRYKTGNITQQRRQ